MGSEYVWKQNPIRDALLQMIMIDVDVSDQKNKKQLSEIFAYIIEYNLKNPEDLVYLDFKIKKTEQHFKVIGNNIVSALWLSGISPNNPTAVFDRNELNLGKVKYTFDKKNKVLKHTFTK
jgi:hypothetical protein